MIVPSVQVMCMGCKVHGEGHWSETKRAGRPRGYCKACSYESVKRRRRAIKEQLVAEAGGRCVRCGYDRSLRALDFHHRDPSQKEFAVSGSKLISLAKLQEESRKCDLLCADCHMEIEEELASVTQW